MAITVGAEEAGDVAQRATASVLGGGRAGRSHRNASQHVDSHKGSGLFHSFSVEKEIKMVVSVVPVIYDGSILQQ